MPTMTRSAWVSQSRAEICGSQCDGAGGGMTTPALIQSVLIPRQRMGDMPGNQTCFGAGLLEQHDLRTG